MKTRVTNESYPSLTSGHTRWAELDVKMGILPKMCTCDECTYEQVFTVEFEYSKRRGEIEIDSFRVSDKHDIDVTGKLNVRDFDKLVIELQDYISCRDVWTKEDEEQRVFEQRNCHYE